MSRRPPPSKQTARMRSLADELDEAEDEEVTGQVHIHVNGSGGATHETGRFDAVEPKTRPDHPAPPSSETLGPPPNERLRPLAWLLSGVPKEHRVWVILALIALLGVSVWKGGGLAGLWP